MEGIMIQGRSGRTYISNKGAPGFGSVSFYGWASLVGTSRIHGTGRPLLHAWRKQVTPTQGNIPI